MKTTLSLDYNDANRAVQAIVEEARRRGKAVTVAVADAHGELLAFARMDGTAITTVRIASNKARTSARIGKPSVHVGTQMRGDEPFDIAFYGDDQFIGWRGGLPVVQDGAVIGAVAVSGLTGEEDEELAALGIRQILG